MLSLGIIYFNEKLNSLFAEIGTEFGDIGDLKKYANEVNMEVERLVGIFESQKESFPDGYLFEFSPKFYCGSMVSSIISGKYPNKTIVALRPIICTFFSSLLRIVNKISNVGPLS